MSKGPDFQPTPGDDDARDPLLSALRQRLGENFGQEPPPELWAGIQSQLPRPRPWWLRRRQLLALLALLSGVLLVSRLAGWLAPAGHPQPAGSLARQPARTQPGLARPAESPLPLATPNHASSQPAARPLGSAAAPTVPAAGVRSVGSGSAAAEAAIHPAEEAPAAQAAAARRRLGRAASSSIARLGPPARQTRGRNSVHRVGLGSPTADHPLAARALASTGARRPTEAALRGHPAPSTAAVAAASEPVSATPSAAKARTKAAKQPHGALPTMAKARARQPATTPSATAASSTTTAEPAAFAAGATAARAANQQHRRRAATAGRPAATAATTWPAAQTAATTLAKPAALAHRPLATDSVAGRRAYPQLTAVALPTPLPTRPDSAGPWLPPVRRWSVLVLAGPSLSYRTGGLQLPANQAYAASPTTTGTSYSTSTPPSYVSSASLFDQELPAVGLGLQAQVRKVLTGRWALALGAGYQEYATQLTAQLTLARVASNAVRSDTTISLHQRDTYRFFTLPVQFSYALGAPHGRLSLGLLGGVEPSWYRGGSTTLVSAYTARNLSFSSATGSPYNYFNLALSLGLDARYRLGGPASRWLLVVQPTARYLATPFVRSTGQGYAARQPYSLGLLTGFSWELR